ncbi:aldose epimerase family protein [Flavivirga amylovorans]|uniref:Aldose 1-epimerase n=1 Tax=Flavivirga amylovorans TaxID=870486 RepID=A0ABT8X3K7_9FLAO|nr:aldose epimerase family protein [Flavivirga amylovorans]MDO5988548.1 aldose epimerase family protein [Flavivirga amylovorans]
MSITISDFGSLAGATVKEYALKNSNGVEIKITDYGATITTIKVPDSKGNIENIACGFDTLDGYFGKDYVENAPYFGGTIGRYCSQIKDAKFSLNGQDYKIADNCGPNNLHGGIVGFDKKIWEAEEFASSEAVGVKMTLKSSHLEEGFPGNVDVEVSFTLTNNNELNIDYVATPDQDTPLSLTNHTYFNLNAFKSNVECHKAQVHANKKLQCDDTGAATGTIVNVDGAPDDMQQPKKIGDAHKGMGDGFENFYVLDNENATFIEAAKITCPDSGRSLTVSTTEPCMLLYTGKYTSDLIKRENGEQYGKYRGFCCETHRYPNGPNIENSPKSITKAGETFKSTTQFKFNW